MPNRTYIVQGTLIHAHTKQPLPNLRIEAWDKDCLFDDLVGSTVTDAAGAFSFTFDQSYFQELFLDRRPDLFFKIFDGDRLVHDTRDSVLWNIRRRKSLVIEVDLSQDDAPANFIVQGHVRYSDGRPIESNRNPEVKAFDKGCCEENQLGKAATPDANGFYTIAYKRSDLLFPARGKANLFVLCTAAGVEIPDSPVVYKAGKNVTIDLTVGGEAYRGHSEYTLLRTAISQICSNKPLADFTEALIDHVANDTGLAKEKITALVNSAKLARESEYDRIEVFYALRHLPASLATLLSQGPAVWRADLENAVTVNLVSARELGDIEAILAALLALAELRGFWPPKPDFGRDEVIDLHALAGLTPKEVEKQNPDLFKLLQKKALDQLRQMITSHFAESPDRLRKHWQFLDLTPLLQPAQPIKDFLRASLHQAKLDQSLIREGLIKISDLQAPETLDVILQPEIPLQNNPLFQEELALGKMYRLGEISKLQDPKVKAIFDTGARVPTLNDAVLSSLVETKKLSDQEANEIGLTTSLYRLFDESSALTEQVKTGKFSVVPGNEIKSIRDLTYFEENDWLNLIKGTNTIPPNGLKEEEYAKALNKKIEKLYPTDMLLVRLTPKNAVELAGDLETLRPLFEHNESVYTNRNFTNLDFTGLDASIKERTQAKHASLTRFANTYPGLHISEILDDRQLSTADKIAQVEERIGVIQKLRDNNPQTELLNLDYSMDSAEVKKLNFEGLSASEQKMAISSWKAYQRMYSITHDIEHTKQIASSGFHSAASIMNAGSYRFAQESGLEESVVNGVFSEALAAIDWTVGAMGWLLDFYFGRFWWLYVANSSPATDDYFRSIDGFEELFGSQDYCQCEHCQSILSPAAYFVDLMYFVDTNISNRVFGSRVDHVLNLKVRRPDLWELPLTCENTHTEIPLLVIVDEILENYIAKRHGFAGDLNNRTAVEEVVYKQLIQKSSSTDAIHSFQQPFLLPLEKLQLYLTHFDRTRGEVAAILEELPAVLSAASLGLSRREYELITQPNTNLDDLKKLYGIEFRVVAGGIEKFDAQLLLKPMGLMRVELGDLIKTAFVTAVDSIQIKGEKRSSDSVQNDVENIYGLKTSSLDRMHRFTRLWRKVTWTIKELDLVLSHMQNAGLASGIQEPTLHHLVEILSIQRRFNISVEELCVLWSSLPTTAIYEDKDDLFDRLFNLPDFVLLDGRYPKSGTKFIHPSFRATPLPAEVDNALHRLLAGLRIGDEALYLLITNLSSPLGLDLTSPDEEDKGFNLTIENLSLLYRHARLAEKLKLSVPDLFQLIALLDVIPANHINGLQALRALLAFYDWWKPTKYSLDELNFITGGQVRNPASFPDPTQLSEQLLTRVEAENALVFADTIFAFLEGVTEEQSREIIEANETAIVRTPDNTAYWLSDTFNPTTSLTIPSGIMVAEPDARALLLKHHATEVIRPHLAALVNVPVEKVKALAMMTGMNLADADFTGELQRSAPATRLIELIEKLLPLRTLFKEEVFDAATLTYIAANPGLFDITDFNAIEIDSVRKTSLYKSFVKKTGEETNSAAVQAVLLAFDATDKFSGADQDLLAEILSAEKGLTLTLQERITLNNTALEALEKLRLCVELAQYLGVGGEALTLIVSEDYGELAQASDAVLGAFRAKYNDEQEWQEKITPFEEKILNRKRDALTDFLIHSIHVIHPEPTHLQFKSLNDLYYYFLVDVQVDGCFRTSRVVAATSSLQLYVHRVLMDLEQDSAGEVRATLLDEPRKEWEWRKHYRVWEANRKVFLYPENWIEPDLRDDKTPLFEEAESGLLQQEINAQTVLDAYSTYMRGFDEVAHLKIAGAYHDRGEETDVLHLFGVTSDDPPSYYYRTVQNAYHSEIPDSNKRIVWAPWRKVELQIPVLKVAPIVNRGKLFVFWVEISTMPQNRVEEANSIFVGYKHKISTKFSMLQLDGTWTPPQKILMNAIFSILDGDGVISDRLGLDTGSPNHLIPHFDEVRHIEPQDGYTPKGVEWELFPQNASDQDLIAVGAYFFIYAKIDLYKRILQVKTSTPPFRAFNNSKMLYSEAQSYPIRKLYRGSPPRFTHVTIFGSLPDYAFCSALLEDRRIDRILKRHGIAPPAEEVKSSLRSVPIANLYDNQDLAVINGSPTDCIIDSDGDLLLLQGSVRDALNAEAYVIKRLGTTLSEGVARKLFAEGVEGLLKTEYQLTLAEASLPITLEGEYIIDKSKQGELDFTGPYGVYYREIFFHTPFLIANHLNSQSKYADAQRWYHFIFNPTANEIIADDPTLTPAQNAARKKDRNWRYREFRGLRVETLREQLTNQAAIETYRQDPFNPHAIARLRLSAYQKCIVMKYIDNLLDWADDLFAEFQMETVNEAIMLYVMASDILGERPAELGDCGEGRVQPKTYSRIAPYLDRDSEFLIEMEHVSWLKDSSQRKGKKTVGYHYALEPIVSSSASDSVFKPSGATGGKIFRGTSWKKDSSASDSSTYFGWSIVRQLSPVFCIPENKKLREYWDRVEDRLFKIRHCMDIEGVHRKLSLFAPEIDPGLLVRAKAAGLSIEDVLNSISGNLPPYRFAYMIEKAKAFASTLQGFSSALMSALERKDAEELNLLRTIQQKNIMALTTQVRKWEIDAATESFNALGRQKATVENRKVYYEGLIDDGLSGWEITQQVFRHTAGVMRGLELAMHLTEGIFFLLPQVGSPFSMKYGGKELGDSARGFAEYFSTVAFAADSVAASAGLEAGFHRREQGWQEQVDRANDEIAQLERQIEAANIRKDIAVKSLEIHEKSQEQLDEMLEFFKNKFTNLGLFTWLSANLQRLNRDAYNSAYAMASLAVQAYRFERNDDTSELLSLTYWDASKAGLLAGANLLIDLQNLERKFMETNFRQLEIDQAFSLTQIAPAALLKLKATGECEFLIPELYFDLFYPGQYRRRIKSARLTIPCITGPYTNVSATLSLTGSQIRKDPVLGDENLLDVPPTRSVTIATSTGQNDSGVFRLDFRDERYMPFEGMGAVNSEWNLSLPKTFRPFDYATINDVIIHISLIAEYDGVFRGLMETQIAAVQGALETYLSEISTPRVFSFRQEFSQTFHRLLHGAVGVSVPLELSEKHFPLFLQGRNLEITAAKLILEIEEAQFRDDDGRLPSSFALTLTATGNASPLPSPLPQITSFSMDATGFGMPSADVDLSIFSSFLPATAPLRLSLTVNDAGDFTPSAPTPSAPSALDEHKLKDVYLYIEYKLH